MHWTSEWNGRQEKSASQYSYVYHKINLSTFGSTFVELEGREFINTLPIFSYLIQQPLELVL